MADEALGAGKEVLSYCGKCKLALAHVIVNMKKNGSVGKCQCKTCNANHAYRDPTAVGKKKPRATRKSKAAAVPIEQLWQEAVSAAKGNPKPYAMDGKFAEGDLIDHPTFGKGFVEKRIDENKIQTLFEHDQKVLICAR